VRSGDAGVRLVTLAGQSGGVPVTSLLALEAVHAASAQSTTSAEQLDLELRRAFFVESRCIAVRHEILAAARRCPTLDVASLAEALDSGVHRGAVMADFRAASAGAAECSGQVVLPDGRGLCNPGITTSWIGGNLPRGTPLVVKDGAGIYDELVQSVLR
jgi:hypothetical protein